MRIIFGVVVLWFAQHALSANNDLPTLGDSSSSLISIEQEYHLGRTWLRNLRQQASVINDPVITEYTENLIYRLASKSEVKDRRLEVILLDQADLNAFAVPGGIVGINAGLFLHALTEEQFASVLAHELAHLSQRHFARQVEESRKQAPIAMATLLGSILLLATNNTEAGFAGLMTSQAAATQWALSYSRDWEREADRLGMQTLVKSDLNPQGMPDMFEQMYNAHRYSERPPEFLLTHPVTENRISDAAARVDALPKRKYEFDISYSLMRTRLLRIYQKDSHTTSFFRRSLERAKSNNDKIIAQYGLALALLDERAYEEALKYSKALASRDPFRNSFQVLYADSLYGLGKSQEALDVIQDQLSISPDNHPLTMTYAQYLTETGQYQAAATQLKRHVLIRAADPFLWQKLSEVEGKANNHVGMHQARAEFFYLTGYKKKALKQLEIALELANESYLTAARIQQRAREISSTSNKLEF